MCIYIIIKKFVLLMTISYNVYIDDRKNEFYLSVKRE